MKITVTGADGGLGSIFSEKIAERGFELQKLTRENADLTDHHQVVSAISSFEPEIVIHAGAFTNVDACERDEKLGHEINVKGTVAVVEGARVAGAKVIFISTDFVFDGKKDLPYLEDDATNPLNVYGKSKRDAEAEVAKLKGSLIVRASWLYGGSGKSFVKTLLKLAESKKEITVVDDQLGAPTYNSDFADAILNIIDKPVTGIINIANSGSCSRYQFAKAVFEEKAIDVSIVPVRSDEYPSNVERPKNSMLDCSRYEKLAGEPLRNWRDALTAYFKDFSNG